MTNKKDNTRGKVLAVIGGQYGSEGKGTIVNHLADSFDVHIRVGGPNAGHSFIHEGELYKMQVIPCGWTNPRAKIVIGRGALVNIDLLQKEIHMIEQVDPTIRSRLYIDERAGVLAQRFANEEGHTKGEIHRRIGSTGEGVGSARVARVNRDPMNFEFIRDIAKIQGLEDIMADTAHLVNSWIKDGKNVLLEGAQGAGLSLIHGPWPYVTSHDTNVAQMCADIGIPPHWVSGTIVVVRSHPIRVAGNSGPLKNETSWEEISKKLGREVKEATTVTRKIRRVGEWDEDLVDMAIKLNDPVALALTFADYIDPSDEGKTSYDELSRTTRDFVDYLEDTWNVPVAFIGTGGLTKTGDFQIIDRIGGIKL